MGGHWGSSVGYLADPTSPIRSHCAIIILFTNVPVHQLLWLALLELMTVCVLYVTVRDTFCSYGVMELCTRGLSTTALEALRAKGVSLGCVRCLCVISEERPRIALTQSFSKLFSAIGLSPRTVSTSFGCRVNVGLCLQVGAIIRSC